MGQKEIVKVRLYMMLDDPDKKSIAVCDGSYEVKKNNMTGEEYRTNHWEWMPRSQIEYEVKKTHEPLVNGKLWPVVIVEAPTWLVEKLDYEQSVIP